MFCSQEERSEWHKDNSKLSSSPQDRTDIVVTVTQQFSSSRLSQQHRLAAPTLIRTKVYGTLLQRSELWFCLNTGSLHIIFTKVPRTSYYCKIYTFSVFLSEKTQLNVVMHHSLSIMK